MRATEEDISKALRSLKKSRADRAAEEDLDFWAVVLIGTERPVQRYLGMKSVLPFSSNEYGWNVAIGHSRDPASYTTDIDRRQWVPVIEHAHVWVPSQAHATRLLGHIDRALLGDDESGRTRNRWRWLASDLEPVRHWEILLRDALDNIELDGEFVETFTDAERKDRIMRKSRLRGRV